MSDEVKTITDILEHGDRGFVAAKLGETATQLEVDYVDTGEQAIDVTTHVTSSTTASPEQFALAT